MTQSKTLRLTQLSLLSAIIVVLACTPLGFIPIPIAGVSVTILHIPVIIGAILLGPFYGGILGLVFGLSSLVRATMAPSTPVDMLFSPFLSHYPVQSLIMVLIPRIILGILPALFYTAFKKVIKLKSLNIGISAALSTALHTIMVLGCLWLFFNAVPFAIVFKYIIGINGGLEIAVAIIISIAVCIPLLKYMETKK